MEAAEVREKTVIVIDDNPEMRKIVRMVLQYMGFRIIVEAEDGQEALDKLLARNADPAKNDKNNPQIDIIVCDWMMPNLSGLELLQTVRSHVQLAEPPFLMITSEADRDAVQTAVASGVTNYIVKPFSAKILEEKIQAMLR